MGHEWRIILASHAYQETREERNTMSHAAPGQGVEPGSPLTLFTEEEDLFRQTVASFANEQVRPLVSQMDREAKMNPDLIRQLFDLGVMGIEIPEAYGGSG